MTTRHRYTLVIEQSGDDRDYIERRLRALLKFMLRTFGFRCTSIEPVKQLPNLDSVTSKEPT